MCWLCTLRPCFWQFPATWLPISSVPQGQTPPWVLISQQWRGPRVKARSHHRRREQWGGPWSSALTLNYWVGLTVVTCSPITTLPARAHRHNSQSLAEKRLENITLSSRQTCFVLLSCVYVKGDSFTLGRRGMRNWERKKREGTETCYVDNFFTLPLKASWMHLLSGLKPLKLI